MIKKSLVLVLALAGCTPKLSSSPTVLLDARLANANIVAGLDTWREVGIEPRVVVVDHDTLLQKVHANDDSDTAYFVAVDDMRQCPETFALSGPAQTEHLHNGSTTTCLNLSDLNHPDGEYDMVKRAAAHEFGHALGLKHAPDDEAKALMLNSYTGVDGPSCYDFASLFETRFITMPERCR